MSRNHSDRLGSAGTKVAVVTSKRRVSVEMALEIFPGLRNVVDRFVTLEDTTQHKPHPEPLLRALELLGSIPKERAAYVGDSFDVEAAKAAGLMSVAVSWGAFSEDALRASGPDHLVPDIRSAVDVLSTSGRSFANDPRIERPSHRTTPTTPAPLSPAPPIPRPY